MVTHELKTNPEDFQAVVEERKTCEIRLDDRGYQVGDELWLKETRHTGEEMASGAPLEYTGRMVATVVTHLVRGPALGLAEGWVCMSIWKD